jgi:hypothetical protein
MVGDGSVWAVEVGCTAEVVSSLATPEMAALWQVVEQGMFGRGAR